MIKYFCDKCGQEIAPNQSENFNRKLEEKSDVAQKRYFDLLNSYLRYYGYVELCDFCHNCLLLELSKVIDPKYILKDK